MFPSKVLLLKTQLLLLLRSDFLVPIILFFCLFSKKNSLLPVLERRFKRYNDNRGCLLSEHLYYFSSLIVSPSKVLQYSSPPKNAAPPRATSSPPHRRAAPSEGSCVPRTAIRVVLLVLPNIVIISKIQFQLYSGSTHHCNHLHEGPPYKRCNGGCSLCTPLCCIHHPRLGTFSSSSMNIDSTSHHRTKNLFIKMIVTWK